jgi:hypothetical protein
MSSSSFPLQLSGQSLKRFFPTSLADFEVAPGVSGPLLPPPIPPPEPLPPPSNLQSPEVIAARQRALDEARRRRGRQSTILTSERGVEDQLGIISRPEARASKLLGG